METDNQQSGDRHGDVELWEQARAGQVAAFGMLFDRHAQAVYGHCFRRTASWSEAEDLTSVVFLEAWRHHRRVELHQRSALPWLLGIANNVLRNRHRSRRRHRAPLDRLPPPAPEPDPAEDVAGRVDDERRMAEVLAAVARLPPRDREVLALVAWAGLDYAAAAAALGVPVGTVRSRLSRARGRLTPHDTHRPGAAAFEEELK